MPKKTNIRIGGFAAQNIGEINNCFSVVKIKNAKDIVGGFAGENIGGISRSFYSSELKKMLGGVSGSDKGTIESSYFFHDEKKNSKKLEKLHDNLLGIHRSDVRDAEDIPKFINELGFDVEEVWEYTDNAQILRFIPDKWLFDIKQSPTYTKYIIEPPEVDASGGGVALLERTAPDTIEAEVSVTSIRTADGLFELAKRINEGDRELASAYIRLEEDLDLGGKEWEPIGNELAKAFTGLFDGCGHTIKNFRIKSKESKAKGFFGYLKGEVYNLTVDCAIKGGTAAGGIAAYCEAGTIGYCAAIIDLKCKSGIYGGLVGSNTGQIFMSYSAGKISPLIIPWWWGLPLLALPLLYLLILSPDNPFSVPIFAPVPYDEDAIPINDDLRPRADGNFVSFQFEQNIDVDLGTGLCKFNFLNPGNSNHDIVVQLHFTDGQAVRVMGSTGRSAEEQQALESAPGYDPENHRTVIAQSGAIPPGYQLEDLRLVTHDNGARLPPGDYNAIVYLIFYDIGTHNRAMLESQLPVVISVHN